MEFNNSYIPGPLHRNPVRDDVPYAWPPEGGGARHYQYQLLSDWFGGLAVAYKRSMDGAELPYPLVIVRDPLGIFDYQKKGDKGYMLLQGGAYYAYQAPCPTEFPPPLPPPPSDSGACCIPVSLDVVCTESTQTDCDIANGVWVGFGSTCDSNPCEGVQF